MAHDLSIYVVEDDLSVLDSLSALLGAHGYATIPCSSAERLFEVFQSEARACILLDLRLPGLSGMELLSRLDAMGVRAPVIVLTAHGDIPLAVQAMRAGAVDFIEKPAQIEQLLDAIALAAESLSGQAPISPPKQVVAERIARLTDREKEVLDHLLLGKLNKEIADTLGVSRRTVEVHRARIREKLQARSVADLIRMVS